MKIEIELDESTLRKLILSHLAEKLGDVVIEMKDVTIEVKAEYKQGWECGHFRARVLKYT